jgi:hypothetical protein
MEDDMTELRSDAAVPTDRPQRWIKQLASHLGRKAEVREDPDGAVVLVLAGGTCRMSGDDALLRLAAGAPDEEALARVEHVVGSHLERFASTEGLTVDWQRAS